MTSCVASASTPRCLPATPMYLPARRTRVFTSASTTSVRTGRLRRRCPALHQDRELISPETGLGPELATLKTPANTGSATTRPVRRGCVVRPQAWELISLKTGPGSGRESWTVLIRPTPHEGSTAQRGAPGCRSTSATTEQADVDQRRLPGQAPHALLPPPAHARARSSPSRLTPATAKRPAWSADCLRTF